MGIATDIIMLVVAAFFCGLLMQHLGQPVILGYIAVGIFNDSASAIQSAGVAA
ncbi:MAG: hypothetical protein KFF68_17970 [Desulfosarcina sp.]|nr:hypothetical protein [Desulfosarcina sp.]